MRENEFEKRVKQKMDGFDLHPSDGVWSGIERRIRKEKKRRFIFWWPLFFLVGGGITAGILLTNKKESPEIITGNKIIEKSSLPGGSVGQDQRQATTTVPAANLNNVNQEISKNITTPAIIKNNIIEIKRPTLKTKILPLHREEEIAKGTTAIIKPEVNKQVSIVSGDSKDKSRNDQQPVTVVPVKPINIEPEPGKTLAIAVIPKLDVQKKDQQPEILQKTIDSTSVEKPNPSTKKSKKWDWGISFSLGQSSVGQGIQFFNGARNFDALQTGPSAGAPIRSPSSIRPSLSWSTGLYLKKSVSKNLDMNLGLSYRYLSTKMNVGEQVDSTRSINNNFSSGLLVNNFYRLPVVTGLANNSDNSNYANQYHFMSLSGEISWKIINGKKLTVYWDNGLQYNHLVSSTMLHYDRSLPGYYKDNNRLVKDQVFIFTGLSLPVGKKVVINPIASYSLTPVLKNTTDTSRLHYSNFGIRIRILLNKNK